MLLNYPVLSILAMCCTPAFSSLIHIAHALCSAAVFSSSSQFVRVIMLRHFSPFRFNSSVADRTQYGHASATVLRASSVWRRHRLCEKHCGLNGASNGKRYYVHTLAYSF